MSLNAAIAANRFGLGARPGEISLAAKDPRQWLKQQLLTPQFDPTLPSSSQLIRQLADYKKARKKAKQDPTTNKPQPFFRQQLVTFAADGINRAIESPHSLSWRLLDFFSNHYSVTAKGSKMATLAPTLEREAIAPHLMGQFEDMLMAVVKHPAMLIYLNNEQSFGPNSRLGKKRRKGLNENLAREILELHTLGINGRYQQQDVQELARGITGWSVAMGARETTTGFKFPGSKFPGFKFRSYGHEPGKRTLLGKNYRNSGLGQGEKMLRDLARHPATAEHLCSKLARHFISDEPSQSLISALTQRWLDSRGNIHQVMEFLIEADESWQPQPQKFKTPREFIISAFRSLGEKNLNKRKLISSLQALGQQPFNAGSPAGYGDNQADWDGASALMARIDWSSMLAKKSRADARQLLVTSLGESSSERTIKSVMRAESRHQALVLLLMSPEFQRR